MARLSIWAIWLIFTLGQAPALGPLRAETTDGAPSQRVHRDGFVPASDEVFEVLTQFFAFDESLPLDPRTVETWNKGGARFEKIVFTTSNGERVPSCLALPVNAAQPYPVAVLVHGLGSSGARWWEPDRSALADSLLAKGTAVFTVDLKFHGERSAANDYQSPVYLTFGDSLFVRSRDMMIQSTIDLRRALDYLAGREDLDAVRTAVVGYSMGGMIAMFMAALEPQLAAIVVCAVPTTTQPAPVDPFEFASRVSVPVRLIIGRRDWLSSPADGRHLLDLVASETKDLLLHDAGHSLPPEFLVEAASWVSRHLTPAP